MEEARKDVFFGCVAKRKLICQTNEKKQRESLMTEQYPFKWRHYEAEIILLCVRWYLRYALSYRDLEEIMGERGLSVGLCCKNTKRSTKNSVLLFFCCA